jgi:phosphomannomutase / phosphoglucomutase
MQSRSPVNPEIFRAYDIRGVADEDLTDEAVELIGRGFGTYARSRGAVELVIGRDNRPSSERIRDAMTAGMRAVGCNVTDVGLVPTPLTYWSIVNFQRDGGVMITASHNPPQYNGIKLSVNGPWTLIEPEIQDVLKIVQSGDFSSGPSEDRAPIEVIRPYIDMVKSKVSLKRRLKVVVDPANATAALVAPYLFEELGCETTCLFCELDGTFPGHHPDPELPEAVAAIRKEVVAQQADAGFAYDGDADRVGVIDEKGNKFSGDYLTLLFARDVLKKHPGAKILFDVKSTQLLAKDVVQRGGVPIMWKAGHSLVKKKLREEGALLAGEVSGHMYFADNYYGFDDGIYASARAAEIAAENGSLSSLLADLPVMYATPEIRVPTTDAAKFAVVKAVRDAFALKYDVIDIDGVRVDFGNAWGLLRPSNTLPVLIARFEADSPQKLAGVKEIFRKELEKHPGADAEALR